MKGKQIVKEKVEVKEKEMTEKAEIELDAKVSNKLKEKYKEKAEIIEYVIGVAIGFYVITSVLVPAITSYLGTDFSTLGDAGTLLKILPVFVGIVLIYGFYEMIKRN